MAASFDKDIMFEWGSGAPHWHMLPCHSLSHTNLKSPCPEQYPKLLAIKDKYDPKGLFVCHHCVGSERWTKESKLNCRAPKA